MKCPNCGMENSDNAKFCGGCGFKLKQRVCPNGHIMKDGEEICSQCATQRAPKVKTIAPEDKGKTLFEINTLSGPASQDSPVKEFMVSPPPSSDVRKTRVVGTGSSSTAPVLSGWLVSFDRRSDGEDFRILSGENIIGAAPNSSVRIDVDTVSSRHAVISYRDGNFYIKDLGSTNGTFVNGVRIDREVLLKDGDNITFGTFNTTFVRFKKN